MIFYQLSIPKKLLVPTARTVSKPRTPIIALSKVLERGNNLSSGMNHADYVSDNGNYDIVSFFIDHKLQFPILSKVVIG